MKSDFELALEFTLKWEGGFVHHPKDPGGRTNKGITQMKYDEYRRSMGVAPRSVAQISDDECRAIYQQSFWSEVDKLLDPAWLALRIAMFDSFVQFGTYGGTWLWQKALGIATDGHWGPITRAATETRVKLKGSLRAAWDLIAERIRYRATRVNKEADQKVFLSGWLNRDTDLMSYVLKLE